jgi:tetratricopeptide (TPR) repeat protein
VQSRRVAREAELVTRERDKALEVRSFLMEMFGASGANRAVGDTVTVRRLLDLQAAALASAYPDRPDLRAELMDVLADGYDRLGLYQEAEPLARQALDLRRASLPAGHPDIAASVNMLGWILHEVGRSREAEPVLREAVAIRRAAGPRYRRDLSRSLNDLGVVLNALSRYDSAEVVLAEALAIRRAELGEEHRAVGITANNLAAAYYYQARLDEATAVQALAVRALEAELGPDHQRVVVALSNLATFRRALGDWEGAAAEYRRLLERQTRLQGADHPVTARVAASLAAVLVEQAAGTGDEEALAEADRLSRGAIAALEARLGPVHPQVGIALEGWRAALHGQGRVREALAAAERSVAILRASLGDDNQNTAQALSGLALAHWRMGDGPRGLRLMREAVAAFERTAGDASPETARIRANLCSIMLWEKVEVREARDLCARAVAALEHAPARFRQMEPVYRLWLAQGHVALGEMHEAAALLDGVRDQINRGTGGAQARRLLDSLSGRVTPR